METLYITTDAAIAEPAGAIVGPEYGSRQPREEAQSSVLGIGFCGTRIEPGAARGSSFTARFPRQQEPSTLDANPGSHYPRWSMLRFVGLLAWSLLRWPCRAIALQRIGCASRYRQQHWQLCAFIHTKFLANDLRSRVVHRTGIQEGEGRTKYQKQHNHGSAQPSLSQPLR